MSGVDKILKGQIPGLSKVFAMENSLKMMKNAIFFTLTL